MTRTKRWAIRGLVAASGFAAAACSDAATGPGRAPPDQPAPDPPPRVIAFVDVRVIHPGEDRIVPGQTVLVRDGVIEAVGASSQIAPPPEAFVIEGFDRHLMPGIVDAHVHITEDTFDELRNDYWLYLANGVTTVRIMWGFRTMLDERERIRQGEILGPTLFVASPGIDGPEGPWTGSTPPVTSAEEARERTRMWVERGYDFIKVYNDLRPDWYDAIVDEADAWGVPVVGHVPSRVGLERVQDAGQATSEHFIGMKLEAASTFWGGVLDVDRARELAARSATAGLTHTPTLAVDALSRGRRDAIRAGEAIRYVAPGVREFFETGFHHGFETVVALRERSTHQTLAREVVAAGGRVLVGTDAGFGWMLPGFAIHDELEGLRGGLTAWQVLRAATVEAAEVLGGDEAFGRIAPGQRADLILVGGSPVAALGVLREHAGVMVRGRWLSRGTLDAKLDSIRASYGG